MPQLDVEGAARRVTMANPGANGKAAAVRSFERIDEDRYRWTLPDIGGVFEIDRLRRDAHQLVGELCVSCDLPGAFTVNGVLTIADFNLSSARARQDRAKLLAERSRTVKGIDWPGLVEEFCQSVLAADRAGAPAVDLRTIERPAEDDALAIEGFKLPRRHPSILFGDGGTAKSYTALYLAGRMVEEFNFNVALFDWELAGQDHRDRLGRLFPDGMPRVLYARCERPLYYEVDRLRRIVRENSIDFAFYDSIGFAADGAPEAAEVAGRYFRAVRQIGGGSLHVAHISKAEGSDKKPFGSCFWHNGARSTWYVKLAEETAESDVLSIGFFNRKANLGRLASPLGFTVSFTEHQTTFRRNDVASSPTLAEHMGIRQRMMYLLRRGAMTPEAIAEEIDADADSVSRTLRRHKNLFTLVDDRRYGLLERVG